MLRDIANDLRDDLCFIAVRGIDNAVGAEDRPQVQLYGAGANLGAVSFFCIYKTFLRAP